jgi:hypothetical protein
MPALKVKRRRYQGDGKVGSMSLRAASSNSQGQADRVLFVHDFALTPGIGMSQKTDELIDNVTQFD